MEDGRIFQQYTNVTKDEYGDYGSALGNAGYSILDTNTEEGIVILTLGIGEEKFTMTYDPQNETMVFIFDADANIG